MITTSKHSADDFTLRIKWADPKSRRYNDGLAVVPGYYLTAGFANEGEATWIYEGRLLTPDALMAIARTVDNALVEGVARNYLGREDGPLGEAIRPFANATASLLKTRREAAVKEMERIEAEMASIADALDAIERSA